MRGEAVPFSFHNPDCSAFWCNCVFNSDLGTKTTLTKADIDARLGTNLPMVELVVKLNQNWAINQHMFAEVVSINNVGGTKIEDGYAVFRGRGNGKTFLRGLCV